MKSPSIPSGKVDEHFRPLIVHLQDLDKHFITNTQTHRVNCILDPRYRVFFFNTINYQYY